MADERQDSAAEARLWVEANSLLVNETYQRFLNTGEWPVVTELQRHFDQRGEEVDVQEVVDAKPRVTNEARLVHTDRLVLQLRHLMWLDNARSLVNICVTAIQRAVASYFSEDPDPSVTSESKLTNFPSDRSGGLTLRAFSVLTHEYPSPFAGSTMQGEAWRIDVDTRFARRFKEIHSVEDFVVRQDEIRAEIAHEAAVFAGQSHQPLGFNDVTFGLPVFPASVVQENNDEENKVGKPLLFLSWGRTASKAVAAELKPMLTERLPGVEIFFSPTSIDPGADPSRRIFDEGLLIWSFRIFRGS